MRRVHHRSTMYGAVSDGIILNHWPDETCFPKSAYKLLVDLLISSRAIKIANSHVVGVLYLCSSGKQDMLQQTSKSKT